MSTAWFERGDGARFEVPLDSEAYANLVAGGAVRILGPGGPDEAAHEPTLVELRARAKDLGVSASGTKVEIAARLAEAETATPEGDAEPEATPDEGGEG